MNQTLFTQVQPVCVAPRSDQGAAQILASIYDILGASNENMTQSLTRDSRFSTDIQRTMSDSASAQTKETIKQISEYLRKQEEAAHQPLWKTILEQIAAVVAIAVTYCIPGMQGVATAMAVWYFLAQMPTGLKADGTPLTLMDRMEDAGGPKWLRPALGLAITLFSAVGTGFLSNTRFLFNVAKTLAERVLQGVLSFVIVAGTTGFVGNSVTAFGGSQEAGMYTNLGVGVFAMVAGITAGLKNATTTVQKSMGFIEAGAQLASSSGDIAYAVIQKDAYEQLSQLASVISALKKDSNANKANLQTLSGYAQQLGDMLKNALQVIASQSASLQQGFDHLGEAGRRLNTAA